MNKAQQAIKTASKIIAILMKIGFIAVIVAICVSAAVLIFLAATGGQTSVTVGGVHFVVADGAFVSPAALIAACAALLVMAAFLLPIYLLTSRMCGEISASGDPFREKHVKTIKTVGILVAVMSLVGSAVDSIASSHAGVETLGMANGATGVVTGAIIYCLAYIFDYGCALQKQVDAERIDEAL